MADTFDAEYNTKLIRHLFEKWHESRGHSEDDWLEHMDDQIDFKSLAMARGPGSEFSAPRLSKAEVGDYFRALGETWELIYYTNEQFIAQHDRVVVISKTAWRNRATGKEVTSPKADVFRLREGKIIEFFEFYDTAGLNEGACA